MILQTHFSVAAVSLFSTFVLHYSSSLVSSPLNIEVWLPILPHEHYLWRIWIMSICPVHDVPVQSTVSWRRRGLAGSWPCFSGSVTSPVAGGLASGSTAAWLGLWGDVTHWAWQSPWPWQSATPLDTVGRAYETPYMSQNQELVMPRTNKARKKNRKTKENVTFLDNTNSLIN